MPLSNPACLRRPFAAMLLALAAAAPGVAQAQSDDDNAPPVRTMGPPVMSDAAPLPAQDRDSAGALVLVDAPPPAASRAQQERMHRQLQQVLLAAPVLGPPQPLWLRAGSMPADDADD